jgi:hypothetical protein
MITKKLRAVMPILAFGLLALLIYNFSTSETENTKQLLPPTQNSTPQFLIGAMHSFFDDANFLLVPKAPA